MVLTKTVSLRDHVDGYSGSFFGDAISLFGVMREEAQGWTYKKSKSSTPSKKLLGNARIRGAAPEEGRPAEVYVMTSSSVWCSSTTRTTSVL
jgi:hypothetical protein